jgi:hypothetical protein
MFHKAIAFLFIDRLPSFLGFMVLTFLPITNISAQMFVEERLLVFFVSLSFGRFTRASAAMLRGMAACDACLPGLAAELLRLGSLFVNSRPADVISGVFRLERGSIAALVKYTDNWLTNSRY